MARLCKLNERIRSSMPRIKIYLIFGLLTELGRLDRNKYNNSNGQIVEIEHDRNPVGYLINKMILFILIFYLFNILNNLEGISDKHRGNMLANKKVCVLLLTKILTSETLKKSWKQRTCSLTKKLYKTYGLLVMRKCWWQVQSKGKFQRRRF